MIVLARVLGREEQEDDNKLKDVLGHTMIELINVQKQFGLIQQEF